MSPKCSEILNKYGNSDNFLALFNPSMQYAYCENLFRCYLGNAPSLALIAEAYGNDTVFLWLEIQLRDLSEFSGCKDKLSLSQYDALARVILLSFYFLKVTELMHFFILFKSGKFGKFFGAVDPLVITEALQHFIQIRYDYIDRFFREQQQQQRALEKAACKAVTYAEYLQSSNHD